jgi:hypothetical protein
MFGSRAGKRVQNQGVSDHKKVSGRLDFPSAAGGTVELFRQLAEGRLRDHGIVGRVAVEPTQTAGLALVSVEIESGLDILFEVADWVPGVRVLDPNGEDLPISAALDYIVLRVDGLNPSTALTRATVPRHRA